LVGMEISSCCSGCGCVSKGGKERWESERRTKGGKERGSERGRGGGGGRMLSLSRERGMREREREEERDTHTL
jgi:hypothetical protein